MFRIYLSDIYTHIHSQKKEKTGVKCIDVLLREVSVLWYSRVNFLLCDLFEWFIRFKYFWRSFINTIIINKWKVVFGERFFEVNLILRGCGSCSGRLKLIDFFGIFVFFSLQAYVLLSLLSISENVYEGFDEGNFYIIL